MGKSFNLGKIEKIEDLRTIWKNEATDFTPWLSENLSLLNDALNMNLVLVETESAVGGYSLDILAEDQDSGDTVIIENQLEQTNHDHLGKLITYASGKKAKKIIWIVKNARDEHRAAIEWLNESTSDELQFFLLEIQLWSIDNSMAAPKFEIIEQPNNWTNAMKTSNSTPGGAAVQFKYNYWNSFNEYAFSKNNPFTHRFKQRKASSDHWYTLSTNSSARSLFLLVNTKTDTVTIDLTLNNGSDKSDFDALFEKRSLIEDSLGKELVWKRLSDKKVSRILLEKKVSLKDERSFPDIFNWYMEWAIKVCDVFEPLWEQLENDVKKYENRRIEEAIPGHIYENLTKYIDELKDDKIGETICDNTGRDGTLEHPYQMPFTSYSPTVMQFQQEVYDFEENHPEYGLNDYHSILAKYHIQWETESMSTYDVSKMDGQGVMALILAAIRAERFCDGALKEFFEIGAIDKWLLRLKEIDEDRVYKV